MRLFYIQEKDNKLRLERSPAVLWPRIGALLAGVGLTAYVISESGLQFIPVWLMIAGVVILSYRLIKAIQSWRDGEFFSFDRSTGQLLCNGKPIRALSGIQEIRLSRQWNADPSEQYELSLRVKGQRKLVLATAHQKQELLTLGKQIAAFVISNFHLIDDELDVRDQWAEEEKERYQAMVRQFEEKFEHKPTEDLKNIESDRTLNAADYEREAAKNLLRKKRG